MPPPTPHLQENQSFREYISEAVKIAQLKVKETVPALEFEPGLSDFRVPSLKILGTTFSLLTSADFP